MTGRSADMKKRKAEYDLPEMTAKMFKRMRPACEVHPELVAAYERKRLLDLMDKLEWDDAFDYKAERDRR